MILYFSVENFKGYKNKAEINFEADMRIKRFACNTVESNNTNILKSLGVYGPNNTGKTCILLALANLKSIMVFNGPSDSLYNFFNNGNHETKFEVKYLVNGSIYKYEVIFNSFNHSYVYEKLSLVEIDKNNKSQESHTTLFERNGESFKILNIKTSANSYMSLVSQNYPLMSAISFNKEPLLKARNDYLEFVKSIEILRMGHGFDVTKTIELLEKNEKAREFIKEFVKNCDLNVSNIGYDDEIYINDEVKNEFNRYMTMPYKQKDNLKVYTEHNGIKVPSVLIDSLGTDKIIAMAGYIYEALHDGKILIIDEIDSSIHHILTRSIVAMFNNLLNNKSQLIFSTHDLLLMNIKNLLRKDQIYLTTFDEETKESKIISFAKEYPASEENGVRGNEDITSYYLKGRFGSIPTPDLFESLEKAIEE